MQVAPVNAVRAAGEMLSILSAATGAIEIGFCDSAGNGFFTEQPADQLERWSLPKDNGSHVVVHWSAAKKACGRLCTK